MLDRLLTKREYEILGLMADGLSTRDISEELSITTTTVNVHRSGVYQKLGLTPVYPTRLKEGAAISCFLQFSGVDNNTVNNFSLNAPSEIDLSIEGVVTHFYIEVDVVDNVIVGGRVVEMLRGRIVR